MAQIDVLFQIALDKKASDLYLIANKFPAFRVEGNLMDLSEKNLLLTPKDLENLIMEILDDDQEAKLEKERDLDFAYSVHGHRFRINIHYQTGMIALAARHIPKELPHGKDLNFTDAMYNIAHFKDGLVLMTGPTGCGKSTTLAALINYIHNDRREHIITLEDPIEFVYGPGKSIIEQREVGYDTPSFTSGLKYILRQDPNVILIGEMRDLETIDAALNAAETGHLVFSTLHTYSASQTIERIIALFPVHRQTQVLTQLAASLRAVISQHLVIPDKVGGRRVAVREIMINNPAIANLIRQNKVTQITSVIQTSANIGMITMEHAARKLVEEGRINEETYDMIMNYYLG